MWFSRFIKFYVICNNGRYLSATAFSDAFERHYLALNGKKKHIDKVTKNTSLLCYHLPTVVAAGLSNGEGSFSACVTKFVCLYVNSVVSRKCSAEKWQGRSKDWFAAKGGSAASELKYKENVLLATSLEEIIFGLCCLVKKWIKEQWRQRCCHVTFDKIIILLGTLNPDAWCKVK